MNTQNIDLRSTINHQPSTAQPELPLNPQPSTINNPMARGAATTRTHRQRTRIERAAWWFRRMHQAVDQAATPNRNLQPAQV